ncbi:MAG: isoleucine--tRNA ligase [Gemmataceae bacterium]
MASRFEKVETQVDFPAQERAILKFWDEQLIFEKLRDKNRGKPRWSFLDGPITANNPMGVHHAWGRTYKDAFQRYFAMTGHDERYQNGFDCQGLWVEVEVEKELKLASKRDIENLVPGNPFASIEKFVNLCKERVNKFARMQTEQSVRLGQWMNWDRTDADWAKPSGERKSYFTMSEENNYTIWAFLKKCHDRKLIYRAFDAMPWCPRCGVGLSEMEVKEGYKLVTHKSVFVKFPLRDRAGENLLVWTTTPWTLSSNVGAAVNPELTYLKLRHKGEIYYLGKTAFTAQRSEDEQPVDEVDVEGEAVSRDAKKSVSRLKSIEQLFKEKGKEPVEVLGELTGAEMVGWTYDGPFDELPAQANPGGFPAVLAEVVAKQKWAPPVAAKDAHRVVAWKEVGATTGTGIVHIAPGCGREDFVLGREQGLPPIAPLDDEGVFLPGFGWLEGAAAVDPNTADRILEDLKKKNRLFATEQYPHSYPHCWRCKTELLFRLVDEWFINMSWRDEIMDVTRQVKFLPEVINGSARELKWLEQMGDWMISKKRFWGLALPIWVDEVTGEFEVIGSREELKERAVEGWTEFEGHTPHRPWIDQIKIRNPKTGNLMSRIGDVGNPWLDAGIVPYSTMGYNHDRAEWEKWFPADFITESFPGQFRNWFYAILAMSTMMERRPPFRVLVGHALVRDEHGETMSKTKGNSIEFNEAADKMGADVMRWLYCRKDPAVNINFGYGPADEVRAKFHIKLWNVYAFFINYARLDGFDTNAPQVPVKDRPDIDRWILSDLQLLIQKSRESFESYNVMAFCLEVESFVDDRLSNWYVRRNRRRFWSKNAELDDAGKRDKLAAYQTLYTVLQTLMKLIAPVVPFLAETMWRNFAETESVHLAEYPTADEKLVDRELSDEVDALLRLVRLAGAARNMAKAKVRQPLAELRIHGSEVEGRATSRFASQLEEELNVKRVNFQSDKFLRASGRLNKKSAAPKLGPNLKQAEVELAGLSPADLESRLAGELSLAGVTLDAADFVIDWVAEEGWVGNADRGTQVALDTRITDELKAEGLAREIIRFVQDARKNADLDLADKIALYLETDSPALKTAITAHKETIAAETQVVDWLSSAEGIDLNAVKIDGQPLRIGLRKV